MRVLVTGGAGYIGSHTVLQLLENGHEIIVIDNLSNSNEISLQHVSRLVDKKITFIKGDILNKDVLDGIFSSYHIDAVIHFAGLKAVGESTQIPLTYYRQLLIRQEDKHASNISCP